jgi:hypothetical protein
VSFEVVLVAEDPLNNGYLLTDLVRRILREAGKPRAHVFVLPTPRTRGYAHAKRTLTEDVLPGFRENLLLFLPDRDGRDLTAELVGLETRAAAREVPVPLFCCAAVEEVETWLLAGHAEKLDDPWQVVRSDVSVKEHYFQPFLKRYATTRQLGAGRKHLMAEALLNYDAILARCPELFDLQNRIRQHLAEHPS